MVQIASKIKPIDWSTVSLSPRDSLSAGSFGWTSISCTLRDNGELNVYTDPPDRKVTLHTSIQLSQLPRSAVQLLDPSLGNNFCVAIYPQPSSASDSQALLFPVFFSYETRVMCEVWYVLLKVLCTPELYGPKEACDYPPFPISSEKHERLSASFGHMFRMDRSMSVRVIEAKLDQSILPADGDKKIKHRHRDVEELDVGLYTEVLLDGDLRARTTLVYSDTRDVFWREDFDFADLPAALSNVRLAMKARRSTRPLQDSKVSLRRFVM